MEYFFGSAMTILTLIVLGKFASKQEKIIKQSFPIYTQSHVYELTKDFGIFNLETHQHFETQATKHFDSKHVRVVILEDYAYWIQNNRLLCAEIDEEGVNKDSTQEVDIMGMDKVQLDMMSVVVEKLTEGNQSDSGNSGNQGLQ